MTPEMEFFRLIGRKSCCKGFYNKEIGRIIGTETSIMEYIQERQLKWFGHVNRMENERAFKQIMQWTKL